MTSLAFMLQDGSDEPFGCAIDVHVGTCVIGIFAVLVLVTLTGVGRRVVFGIICVCCGVVLWHMFLQTNANASSVCKCRLRIALVFKPEA